MARMICIYSLSVIVLTIMATSGIVSCARRRFKFAPRDPNLVGIYRTLINLADNYGHSVSVVLDVGANTGEWSNDFKLYFPNASFFLIEGNEDLTKVLQERGFPSHIGLVGNEARDVTFFKSASRAGTGNSIFKEQGWNNAQSVVAKMLPIDSIVQEHHVGPFDFVKLDVQGAELMALLDLLDLHLDLHLDLLDLHLDLLDLHLDLRHLHLAQLALLPLRQVLLQRL
jgi:FkbM family methyltransferase